VATIAQASAKQNSDTYVHTLFGARLGQWSTDPQTPPAIVMPGREVTFSELRGSVENCAAWLVREGCRPSQVVGITIAEELTNLVVSLALLHLGVPQVCLPTYDPPAMRLRLARRLAVARIVVTDQRHALPGRDASLLTPETLARANDLQCAAVAADPDATAMYFTSSGTTGEAKVIALSQRMVAGRAERRNLTPGERMLMLATVEDYPAQTKRLYCLYRGLTSVLQSGTLSPPLGARELCAHFGVTRLNVNVLQASSLAPDGSAGSRLPAGLKVFVSGSRVPTRLRQAFRTGGGAALFVEYGAREVGGIANTCTVDRDEALETVGTPHPEVELEIVDRGGKALPPGEVGEIRVRSPDMIGGFYQDPVATARYFRDGWFHPGDIGSLTASGSLCIHGRADDMMNLNGIKIFPAEIERVLEEHPAVKAAAAFAVPSAVHGDIPVAAVELHDGTMVGVDELMARAREGLGVRAPRRIVVLEALPRNASGKIVKRDLVGAVVSDR